MLSFGEADKVLKPRLGYGRNLLAAASRIDLSVRCPSEGILLLAKTRNGGQKGARRSFSTGS